MTVILKYVITVVIADNKFQKWFWFCDFNHF